MNNVHEGDEVYVGGIPSFQAEGWHGERKGKVIDVHDDGWLEYKVQSLDGKSVAWFPRNQLILKNGN